MKKRILTALMALVMLFSLLPVSAMAAEADVVWAGAMNFNDANNQVTDTASVTSPRDTELKWAYPLNTTAPSSGNSPAYYAGQTVIVDGYLYATGGGKLHKVEIATGLAQETNVSAGSNGGNEIDYVCYGGGNLYVSVRSSITAFRLSDLSQVWQVSGEFGQYHPMQYLEHDGTGYIWCNGFVFAAADGSVVNVTESDDTALSTENFAWSSGAQTGGFFYVTDKYYAYAIDMSTWKIVDKWTYFSGTAGNTSGQMAYDGQSGRLFWGCKANNGKNLYSIEVAADGTFVPDSGVSVASGFTSICAPVIHDGRVYLIGQGKPYIAVFEIGEEGITKLYDVGSAYKTVQSNPILSTAGGEVRLYFQYTSGELCVLEDGGTSGTVSALTGVLNYTGVSYPYSYDQIAMDRDGNLYCYNESGYLFCYGKSPCEVPLLSADLSTAQVKYAVGAEAAALTVEASVSDGGTLTYQWQSSPDGLEWTDITDAELASYTPGTDAAALTYYRCVITNTKDGESTSTASSAAKILVKVLSTDVSLNVAANTANSLTSGSLQAGTVLSDGETNIVGVVNYTAGDVSTVYFGAVNEGTLDKKTFTLYQGLPLSVSTPSVSNVSTSDLYTNRYTKTNPKFTLPFVASVEVTAEDGVGQGTVYIVVDNDAFSSYAVAVTGLTSEDACFASGAIAFTEEGQTVTLQPQTVTIGTGEEDRTAWSWETSDSAVATVDENGVVTCVGGGEATITFTCGRMTATCDVAATMGVHTHTYIEGVCSSCGAEEPDPVKARFTLAKDGSFVMAKDGVTELYQAELTVTDADCDGSLTLNDAFLAAHSTYSVNGAAGFATEESAYGAYITKLWGIENAICSYKVNDAYVTGLSEILKADDQVYAYFYGDTTGYSDVYTYFEEDSVKAIAGSAKMLTVKGDAGGNAVAPAGAAVTVYNADGEALAALSTSVGADGSFAVTFPEAGTYTVEVSGTASYSGSVWDSTLNEGSGGYREQVFTAAPVIPSRLEVEVYPAATATVYVSISDQSGNFVTGKSGQELYRAAMTVCDNGEEPDGKVTIREVLAAVHAEQHADGAAAFVVADSTYGDYITKFWGIETSSVSYYFNDVYMAGDGTSKTGTNGRTFRDELLDTVVEDNDCLAAYLYQDVSKWSDIFTYFDPVTDTATVGQAKTLTVKAGAAYTGAQSSAGAQVRVLDAEGTEQTALNTTVAEDGTFTVTFPKAGTYTVEVRTNGTAYFVPSRCKVTVTSAGSGSGGDTTEEDLTVSISVVNPKGGYFKSMTSYTVEEGTTALDLLKLTGLDIVTSGHAEYGEYVESINGIGEFDEGSQSGWMYKVNGEFPDGSSARYVLENGDEVEWVYTRDLGADVGDNRAPSKEEEETTEAEAELPFTDIAGTYWARDAVAYVYTNGLMNGTSATVFSPEVTTTRGMIVTILHRLEKEPAAKAAAAFPDVAEGSYCAAAVAWAAENGIVNGYADGTFAPDQTITREQLAAILYRYAKYKGQDVSVGEDTNILSYKDAFTISEYAVPAIQWACGEGILTGKAGGVLDPRGSATRAQVATILMRYLSE